MPTPQPPLLLVDNWFDVIQQYPTATLTGSSEAVGREARRVADYRRERTYWMPASAGERAHVKLTGNTPGGTDQYIISGVLGAFQQASTSHTFAFLLRSNASTAATQALMQVAGVGGSLIVYRTAGTGRLGFFDGATKDFGAGSEALTDDVFHTVIFVFDASSGLAKVYRDGAQVGTVGGVAYTPRALNPGAGSAWAIGGHGVNFDQALSGRIGRSAYWNTAQTANVAAIHAALIGEDRTVGNIISTATYEWDFFYSQQQQTIVERRAGVANLMLGRTTSVESSPAYDPFYAGGHAVATDLGAGSGKFWPAPDALWIDRGHNLWGCYLVVEGLVVVNPSTADTHTSRCFLPVLVPSLDANGNYVAGGDPTTGFSVTEEGALYTLLGNPPSSGTTNNSWRVRVVAPSAAFTPIVPGIILGKRTQLPYYSATYDEDQGERVQRTEQSDTGYLATSRVYSYRTLDLDLQVIGDTTYDSQIRALRKQLFEANQPAVVALNYGMNPERAWLFQAATNRWGFPKKGAYRAGKLSLREVGAKIR